MGNLVWEAYLTQTALFAAIISDIESVSCLHLIKWLEEQSY